MTDQQGPWVLATDVDNTLTGDRAALDALREQLDALREKGSLYLVLATGRRLSQVLHGFENEGLPRADAIVSQVGTEIYLPPFEPNMAPLAAWDERLKRTFSRRQALAFVEGLDGVRLQPDKYNTALKVSFYADQAPDPDAVAATVRRRIASAGAGNAYRVVWSSGKDLDIIPATAGKANAVVYLAGSMAWSRDRIIAAGDSGNDLSMLTAFSRGVVVANAQPELQRLREQAANKLFFATADCAGGVMQGLQHYGVLNANSNFGHDQGMNNAPGEEGGQRNEN